MFALSLNFASKKIFSPIYEVRSESLTDYLGLFLLITFEMKKLRIKINASHATFIWPTLPSLADLAAAELALPKHNKKHIIKTN